jgi:type VI secretion system secreted protein VgrG
VTVISVGQEISISASTKIELVAGQSSIVLQGGDISFTMPGKFSVQGSAHAFLGGESQAASLPALPVGGLGMAPNWIEIKGHYADELKALAGSDVLVKFGDGTSRTGTLDDNGYLRMDGVPAGPVKFDVTEKKVFDPASNPAPTASASVDDWRSAFAKLG